MTIEHIFQIALAVFGTAIATWVLSSFTKASKKDLDEAYKEFERQTQQVKEQIAEFERRVVNPLVIRLERVELRSEGYVTRAELKESIHDLKELINAGQERIKGDLKTLFFEVRKRQVVDDDGS